jgi:hypothetical protein
VIDFVTIFFVYIDFSSLVLYSLSKISKWKRNLEQVKVGHERWCEITTLVNTRLQAIWHQLELSQKSQVVDVDVDLDDIHKLFADKGQGPHMLLIEFEAKTAESVICPSLRTGRDVNVWIWKHKITDAEACRYLTASGKGYDTGVLSRYLRGLKETTDKVAYEHAQVILLLNSIKSVVDLTQLSPSKPPPSRDPLLKQWVSCFVLLFLVLLCLTFAFLLFQCLFFFLSCRNVFFLLWTHRYGQY